MNLNNVPSGINVPDDIYVIIEISSNSDPVKYEIDKKLGVLFVDRFIPSAMFYPCNYGYINNTLALDGDPLDVMVITPYPLYPKSVISCRPIGILNMTDDAGPDAKIIALPSKNIINEYDKIKDIFDLPKILIAKIAHFFEHYKSLEKNKWVKIDQYLGVKAAKDEIIISLKRAKNNKI